MAYLSKQTGVKINYNNTSSIIAVITVIGLFSYFKEKFKGKSSSKLSMLANLTFGIYLIHFLIEKILLSF